MPIPPIKGDELYRCAEYMKALIETLEFVGYTYKAVAYTGVAAYNTGLTTELAAGWHPHATTNLATDIIVTYRKRD